MQTVSHSWITIHLARLHRKEPVNGSPFEGRGRVATGYHAPLAADGWRAAETDTWGGIGFYRSRAEAEAALSGPEADLPFSGASLESWHGLLAVVTHRGCIDFSLDGKTRPVFAPLVEDPGGTLAVITPAGYLSGDETQHARIKDFMARMERVRASYAKLPGNVPRRPLNMVGARDGLTFSIWRSQAEMVGAAYKEGAHRDMLAAHKKTPMFDHSSFTRLRLLSGRGTWQDIDPMAERP